MKLSSMWKNFDSIELYEDSSANSFQLYFIVLSLFQILLVISKIRTPMHKTSKCKQAFKNVV